MRRRPLLHWLWGLHDGAGHRLGRDAVQVGALPRLHCTHAGHELGNDPDLGGIDELAELDMIAITKQAPGVASHGVLRIPQDERLEIQIDLYEKQSWMALPTKQ